MWVALGLAMSCSDPDDKGSDDSSTTAGGDDTTPGDDGAGDGGSGDGGSDSGAPDGGGDDGKMDDGADYGGGDDGTGDDSGDTGAKPGALDGTWTGQLYIEVTDVGLPADCIDGGVTLHVTKDDVEGTGGCFVTLLAGDDKVHLDLVGTVSGGTMSGTLHGSTSIDSFDTTWTADFPHSKINLWGVFEAKTSWFAYDGKFSLTRMDE